ncbi:MAG: universal stress protein [Deltaproteobacteria bacterium]|nr:universal stress protein [Deltaproteobacteria bacterium]
MTQSRVCPGPWKKLLVCTDGSPNSQVAVNKTLALARLCGSTVLVLQVLQTVPEFESVGPDPMVRLDEEIRRRMEAITAQATAGGVMVKTRICRSVSPGSAILEEIERLQPDLVVMGRHGKTGLERLMPGSVTARVIGLSPVKVLVVPLGATLGFSRILIAGDGSPCSAAAFSEALAIARQMRAKLLTISVAPREPEMGLAEEILQNLNIAAQEQGVDLESRVLVGAPDTALVEAAQKSRVELIVLGCHGRTGFKRLLLGSVAEKVIGRAACPVLVVNQTSGSSRP